MQLSTSDEIILLEINTTTTENLNGLAEQQRQDSKLQIIIDFLEKNILLEEESKTKSVVFST
jgi:hypothetical protein